MRKRDNNTVNGWLEFRSGPIPKSCEARDRGKLLCKIPIRIGPVIEKVSGNVMEAGTITYFRMVSQKGRVLMQGRAGVPNLRDMPDFVIDNAHVVPNQLFTLTHFKLSLGN